MTSSLPVDRPVPLPPATPTPVGARPQRMRDHRHPAVVAALLAVVLVAAVLVLRGRGGPTARADSGPRPPAPIGAPTTASTTAPASTTLPASTAPTAPDQAAPPPVPGQEGAPTTAAPAPGVVVACTLDPAEALRLLRASPPLAPLAAQLRVRDPRCAGGWATVVVSTAATDDAVAVLRDDGSGWRLVLLGDAEPCSGLGIPPEVEPLLECDRASG